MARSERNTEGPSAGRSAPGSTYRLQLHGGFTLRDAAGLAGYLARLGVTHVYCSPFLGAAAGSTHGYDVVDPGSVDAERGGEAGLEELASACRGAGLGIVADIVPNHLDISTDENAWWRDVLALGLRSGYAGVFDVVWDLREEGSPAVTLPVLGETLAEALEGGRIGLDASGAWPSVRYYEKSFPLSAGSAAGLARGAAERAGGGAGEALVGLAARLEEEGSAEGAALSGLERSWSDAIGGADGARAALEEEASSVAGRADALGELLDGQHYRLMLWRKEARELNYRRFFDINTMIGTRLDRPGVFELLHGKIVGLVRGGVVGGLRVDHPDGLRDPAGYFEELASATGGVWTVAEKILEADEPLRRWAVAGTTGYDFLNDVLGVLIDSSCEEALTSAYASFAREEASFGAVALDSQRSAARELLAADLSRLTDLLSAASPADDRLDRDWSSLSESTALLAACTPVYRAYVVPERGEVSAEDRLVVEQALEESVRLRPDLAPDPLGAVADLLLLRSPAASAEGDAGEAAREFVARFQQYSAPVMAKGVEDTAFYRHHRLIALNEVGGDPGRFGLAPQEFHARCAARCSAWPEAMLTTSTHDTKRSEDVRARLAVLSECAEEWAEAANAWSERAEAALPEFAAAVDENTQYLLFQTLAGAWPIDAERAWAFMQKAVREGKVRTSWREPDEKYERALEGFVRGVLDDEEFVSLVGRFASGVLVRGRVKALAQVLLRSVCPGVPDVYQGCELWDLSLVDPDNRRPVDFALRSRLLDEVSGAADGGDAASVWAALDDPEDPGGPKLLVLARALAARRRWSGAFSAGSGYEALACSGEHAGGVLALARNDGAGHSRVCAVVPRLSPPADWSDTMVKLPTTGSGEPWERVLWGGSVDAGPARVSEVLGGAAVGLLVDPEGGA